MSIKTKASVLESNKIDTPALPSQILSIGTTNASSIEINGGISAPTASGVVSLFSSTTTGDIGLGSAQTGGILNLGTGASRTSSINIGSLTNTGNISIETASVLNTNASPAIGIGTSSSVKTIKINNNTSSVHCSSIDLAGSTINNITGTTGDVSVGSAQTGGTLNLGTNSARTGTISIGALTGTSTNTISIGTASSGAISIGKTGQTTTVNGALTSTQLLTGTAGITSTGIASLNGGFQFPSAKSNLTGQPYYIQTGVISGLSTINSSSLGTPTTVTFANGSSSTAPLWTNNSNGKAFTTACLTVILTTVGDGSTVSSYRPFFVLSTAPTTTGFTLVGYNPNATNNAIGSAVQYIAIGY